MGTYTFIGGLGATFYVSYFNTFLIYLIMTIFLVKVYFDPSEDNPLGSVEEVYKLLACSEGPEGNTERSFLTMRSYEALVFGIINIVEPSIIEQGNIKMFSVIISSKLLMRIDLIE
ncbi:hypothetical protein CAPTEDRAFT_189772 [Capitella teleta]|uniref:Uncharacterized protein n=1 Tax=Capitella teleta TaxID=283909 RepID=R7UCE9_CAPTE|nr:hypothetical protein CAPTEDRAFT_189772 [Capitella teleta]|eukprot:ELU01443.1 hypothetical protein CAPTEDRAFT_189772 [Capitella teleta]